jgi:hypothetical protein
MQRSFYGDCSYALLHTTQIPTGTPHTEGGSPQALPKQKAVPHRDPPHRRRIPTGTPHTEGGSPQDPPTQKLGALQMAPKSTLQVHLMPQHASSQHLLVAQLPILPTAYAAPTTPPRAALELLRYTAANFHAETADVEFISRQSTQRACLTAAFPQCKLDSRFPLGHRATKRS